MNTDVETSHPSIPRPTGGHSVVRWMRFVLIGLAILCGAWAGKALIVGDADSVEYRAARKTLLPFLTPPGEPRHRVLLVGWDGATFDMIDQLVAAGHLPNVRRMMDRGVSLELESTIIPISSAAWTSAMTGKNPSKTGIFSFFKPVPGSYAVKLISAADRRAAPLWRILNHFGLKTNVAGVPITYPPEIVDGVMISGMLSPFDADYAWPKGLADALRSLGFVPDIGIWRKKQEVSEPVVVDQHARKARIMRVLLEESDWDITVVVFKSLDEVKHRVYQGVPGRDITEHYERLDNALGQLIQSSGPNTDVLLMSDHGFGMYDRRLSINGCLVELGLAALSSNPQDLSPGEDQPFSVGRAVRHLNEVGELNMSGTKAFSYWYEGNYASVRVNLQGREPQGIVSKDEYESVVNEIRDALLSFRLEQDGPPVFTRVEKFEDVYPGPFAEMMPDLLIEADRKYQCRSRYSQPVFTFYAMNPMPDHELMGVLVAAGPSIGYDPKRGRGSVMDIAPTVMQLFSLPPFAEMDGRVLVEIFKSPQELTRIDEPTLPPWLGTGAPVGNESDDEVIERLRALGYVGDTKDEPPEQE